MRPENGRKIGPALWPERGPGMESPCALLSLLQDMLPDVFRVRLPLSACLSFRVPRRGPCLHSWPCCMCPSSVSLVAWCLRCLHSLVAMKIYSTLCPTSVCKPGRRPAFCRERHLFAWACEQNVEKGLASTNAAVSREHVTAPDPAETHASAPAAHARTLRSRSDRIARWSRRRNARRGFFKAGERLPVEARRTKAAFPVAFGAASEKGGPETDPNKKRPP